MLAIPRYLIPLNPCIRTCFRNIRIIARIQAINQRLYLIGAIRCSDRQDEITHTRQFLRSFFTNKQRVGHQQVIDRISIHSLRIVVSHRNSIRDIGFLHHIHDEFPPLQSRLSGHDIPCHDNQVGFFFSQYSQDSIRHRFTFHIARMNMDVCQLSYFKFTVLIETKLRINRSRFFATSTKTKSSP